MRREIAISVGGRDIAGLRRQSDSVVFYSGDKGFTVHATAHNPAPERGYPSGGLRLTREQPREEEPAAAIFIAPLNGATFERSLDDLARAVSLGSLIAYSDEENLSAYRHASRRITRMTLPTAHAYSISAWLIRQSELWAADTGDAGRVLVDSDGPTWMVLVVEEIPPDE